MTSILQSNKPVQKSSEVPSIDSSLKELVTEAKTLFKVLDSASNKIRELESALAELKAHFSFRYKIDEEHVGARPVEEHHRATYSYVEGVDAKVCYYLGWEKDDTSQKYRLCLISEETEIIHMFIEGDHIEIPGQDRVLSKKPLIETDLSTRLRHSQHLLPFIDSFKEFIKSSRITIEISNIPF